MKAYKDPSFQDRVSRAAEARQKALDNLRAKPPLDEKVVAERIAARERREESGAGGSCRGQTGRTNTADRS